LAYRFLCGQGFVSGYIIVRFIQSGLCGLEVGLRLRQRSLERLGVNLIEELAFFDEGTLGEIDGSKVAFHARADFHILRAQRGADQLDIDRNIFLSDFSYLNFGRFRRRRLLFRAGVASP
jgi:hypothetical protein